MQHELTKVSAIRSLFPIAKELKPPLKLVMLTQCIGLTVLGIASLVPLSLKYLIEELQKGNHQVLLWVPPVAFVFMSLLAVGHMVRGLLSHYISIKVSQAVQQRMFQHFLADDIESHNNMALGEKVSRMTFDIQWFVQGASIFLSETLYLPFVILGCSAIMFYLAWKLALIALIVSPLALLAGKPFSKKLRLSSMGLQSHYAILSRHILDSLKGLLLIKVFAREAKENLLLEDLLSTFIRLDVKNNLWASLFRMAISIGNAFVLCLVAWFAFYLFNQQEGLSLSTLIPFATILFYFFGEVAKLGGVMNVLTRAAASCDRIFEILHETNKREEEGRKEARFEESVEFDDISFSYGDVTILEDVNLTIKKGERVAVMGMSGVGKTTLIHLMLGLLTPQKGTIKLDGVNIKEFDSVQLRNLFGYSPQLSVLFYKTVGENIAFSRPEATHEEIMEAAKIACAHDFITSLPQGYDTLIGEDGANLSEGQRQRLALARGILRDAPFLILDESSAQVDLVTEKKIYQNIMSKKDKTVILVSHRPSVLREADRILSIAEGRLVDIGTFSDFEENLSHSELLRAMEFIH